MKVLSSRGLHYGQESIDGELSTWMKEWAGYQYGGTFLKRSSSEVKFLGQPQSLGQETWPPKNSNLSKTLFNLNCYICSILPSLTWTSLLCYQARLSQLLHSRLYLQRATTTKPFHPQGILCFGFLCPLSTKSCPHVAYKLHIKEIFESRRGCKLSLYF
jgi:hypothetical protein